MFGARLPAAGAQLRGPEAIGCPTGDLPQAAAPAARPADTTLGKRQGLIPSKGASCVINPAWPDKALFRMRADRTLRPVFADCSSRPAGIGQDQDNRRNPPEAMCAPQRIARSELGGRRRRSDDAGWLEYRFPFPLSSRARRSVGRIRASGAGETPFHSRSRTFKYFFESPTARFAGPSVILGDLRIPGQQRAMLTSAARRDPRPHTGIPGTSPLPPRPPDPDCSDCSLPRARIGSSTPRLETVEPDAGYERRLFPSEPS